MSEFEHCTEDFHEIEAEIARHGVTLGIDWSDPADVRQVVRDALDHRAQDLHDAGHGDRPALARIELCGLAALMLKSIQECYERNQPAQGGPVWQALAAAMKSELEQRSGNAPGAA